MNDGLARKNEVESTHENSLCFQYFFEGDNMKIKAGLLIVTLLTPVVSVASDTYQVFTSVYKSGKLVASPTMVVLPGKMASITIGNNFSYNLTVKPRQNEMADVVTMVAVGDDTIKPLFSVAYNKEATIDIGAYKTTILVSKHRG